MEFLEYLGTDIDDVLDEVHHFARCVVAAEETFEAIRREMRRSPLQKILASVCELEHRRSQAEVWRLARREIDRLRRDHAGEMERIAETARERATDELRFLLAQAEEMCSRQGEAFANVVHSNVDFFIAMCTARGLSCHCVSSHASVEVLRVAGAMG